MKVQLPTCRIDSQLQRCLRAMSATWYPIETPSIRRLRHAQRRYFGVTSTLFHHAFLKVSSNRANIGGIISPDVLCVSAPRWWMRVSVAHGLDIQAAPHVPAGHTAVGFPGARDLFHVFRFRQLAF